MTIATKFDIDLELRLLSNGIKLTLVNTADIAYLVAGTPTPLVPTARAHWKPR